MNICSIDCSDGPNFVLLPSKSEPSAHSLTLALITRLPLANGMLSNMTQSRKVLVHWTCFLAALVPSPEPWEHAQASLLRKCEEQLEEQLSPLCWPPYTSQPPQSLQPTRDRCLRKSHWDQSRWTQINFNKNKKLFSQS